jgi:hypothetical protein
MPLSGDVDAEDVEFAPLDKRRVRAREGLMAAEVVAQRREA